MKLSQTFFTGDIIFKGPTPAIISYLLTIIQANQQSQEQP